MTWRDIPGWFNWAPFYDRAIASAPHGSTLVEIGVYMGRSFAYLASRAKAANKSLRVIGVDTFQGSAEHVHLRDKCPEFLVSECYRNLSRCGLIDDVTLIVADSGRASMLFGTGTLHMVFIDAAHDAESVRRDLQLWAPKVHVDGMLGGDDYLNDAFPGVKAEVDRFFGDMVRNPGYWWEVRR